MTRSTPEWLAERDQQQRKAWRERLRADYRRTTAVPGKQVHTSLHLLASNGLVGP